MSIELDTYSEVMEHKGALWGLAFTLEDFVDSDKWTLEQKHLALAVGSGTRTPHSQLEYYRGKPEGLQQIVDRVNAANYMQGQIREHAKLINPALHNLLVDFKPRDGEKPGKPGKLDEGWAPEFNENWIAPTATPVGFFAPRLLMALSGDETNGVQIPEKALLEQGARTEWAFNILDEALLGSETPEGFAVELAKAGKGVGLKVNLIMGLMFKRHKYIEENNKTANLTLLNELITKAPEIWSEVVVLLNDPKEEGWKKMLNEFLPEITP